MPVIDLSKGGGRVLRRSIPQIQGKKMIGRGMFAAVYDNGDSVLKLTCDSHNYQFHADRLRPQGQHFPSLLTDFGEVGDVGGVPFYLVEIERLQAFRRVPGTTRLARRLALAIEKERFKQFGGEPSTHQAQSILTAVIQQEFPANIRGALERLCNFIINFDSALDLHMGNMMARASGELVMSDPVFDQRLFANYLSNQSIALAA